MKIKRMINQNMLKQLILENHNGNNSEFGREIGLFRSQVSKILKTGRCAGSVFLDGFIKYCEKRALNYRDYIFYADGVKKVDNVA